MVARRNAVSILTVLIALLATGCEQPAATARHIVPAASGLGDGAPYGYGVVVGQIGRCYGPPAIGQSSPRPPHPAGTVIVLRGSVEWLPAPNGGAYRGPLPTETVTSEWIPEGGTYRFNLPPGPYVLALAPFWIAGVPGVPSFRSGISENVSVVAGQTISQNVPGECW